MATKVSTLLDLIDNETLLLPEFQRGYVWNRNQVRGLMRSLYRRYPVGSLLVWQTPALDATTRGQESSGPGYVDLLLDGQQRVTTLYGISRGTPPEFFEGKAESFTGLHFNIEEETFEFYSPAKMKGDSRWIDVTTLMKQGIEPFIQPISESPELSPNLAEHVTRLNRITGIKDIELHVERITGPDKTVDVVVEIFDRVNSGGTKLSKADLALSKLCAEYPAARARLRGVVGGWQEAGYGLKLDWLLRVTNGVINGEAKFTALDGVSPNEFEDGLQRSEKAIDAILNNLSAHLGIDHDRVLGGRYALPVMARYLDRHGGKFPSSVDRDKVLYWYLHAALWGRFSSSVETVLNQDYEAIDEGGVDALIDRLRSWRGDLSIRPDDFAGYSLGARFYPLLYVLTRVMGARDWWGGAPALSAAMLGKLSGLQVHHIFPKARLYEHGYNRSEVNSIANFCFLTQDTNLWVTDRDPAEYFHEIESHFPGALASQWVPMDESLWSVDRYLDFLEARRELLADAANQLLDGLMSGTPAGEAVGELAAFGEAIEVDRDQALVEADELIQWLVAEGYAKPEIDIEIVDPETGEEICVAEAAWMEGLQEGLGEPVLLEFELNERSEAQLAALGYRAFPTPESLRSYVERRAREEAGEPEEVRPDVWRKRGEAPTVGAARGSKAALYSAFWTAYLDRVTEQHPAWMGGRTPASDNWMDFQSPIKGTRISLSFAHGKRLRHELYIDTGDRDKNVSLFEAILAQRETAEEAYGRSLEFEALPNARASRIADYRDDADVLYEDRHDEFILWFLDAGVRLRNALSVIDKPSE